MGPVAVLRTVPVEVVTDSVPETEAELEAEVGSD
jgi:hypothetical protein